MSSIDGKGLGLERASRVGPLKARGGGQREIEAKTASTDRVAISEELEALSQVALGSRLEEVDFEGLKEAIRSGEYQPDLEGLASRVLENPSVLGEFIDD